jgi:iron-sulfur cluster repair protein YtfE (RIC family)
MSDTKIRVPRATDLLKEDHRRVRRLFDEYAKIAANALTTRRRAFERIHEELTLHGRIEEEVFYPAVAESDDAAELLEEAREAHDEINELLEELTDLAPHHEAFDAKMDALREAVERHVEEEERGLFPEFEELDEDVREDVAERLFGRREELAGD